MGGGYQEDKEEMRIITINIPVKYLESIDLIVRIGPYPSRSEAMRSMLREWIDVQLANLERLGKFTEVAKQVLMARENILQLDYNENAQRKSSVIPSIPLPPKIEISELVSVEIVENPDGSKTRVREFERKTIDIFDKEGFVRVPNQKYINEE